MKASAAAQEAGLLAALIAWVVVFALWLASNAFLHSLLGMGDGGDMEAPLIISFGGVAYALGLAGVLWAAAARKSWILLPALGLASWAEWLLVGYLDRLRRFMSSSYLDSPGDRPPTISGAAFDLWVNAALIVHLVVFILSTAAVYLVVRRRSVP